MFLFCGPCTQDQHALINKRGVNVFGVAFSSQLQG
jgi:hypothetical protein